MSIQILYTHRQHKYSKRYELKQPDENGRNWIASMGLFLGTWQGTKQGRTGYWLRWWDEAGNLLLWGVWNVWTRNVNVPSRNFSKKSG